jgi:hypothetical protein
MNRFHRQPPSSSRPKQNVKNESLSEQRYAELLKSASDFFASSVVATDDQRQTAIDEINERMAQYGLTVKDLQ